MKQTISLFMLLFLFSFSQSEVSRTEAMFSSFLLPGSGEIKLGYNKRGTCFLLTEIMFIAGSVGFSAWTDWRKKDAIAFASEYASIDLRDKDEEFFLWLSTYDNMHEFNEFAEHYRRPDDYLSEDDGEYWDWESEDHQAQFERFRATSRITAIWAKMAIGAIVTNHIVSVLDTMYLHNRSVSLSTNIGLNVLGANFSVLLSF